MADILNYTTTEQVAALLGVTDKELGETLLTAMGLDVELRSDLYSWCPTHATIYAYIGDGTDAQQHQADLLVSYAKYFCAYLAARTLTVSIPQSIESAPLGQKMSRQSSDWAAIRDDMFNAASKYRSKLEAELSAETYTLPRLTVITGVSPDTDPTVFNLAGGA